MISPHAGLLSVFIMSVSCAIACIRLSTCHPCGTESKEWEESFGNLNHDDECRDLRDLKIRSDPHIGHVNIHSIHIRKIQLATRMTRMVRSADLCLEKREIGRRDNLKI